MTGDDSLTASIQALREAYEEAITALRAMPPTQEAFSRATELADYMRELSENASDERALTAGRIAEAEQLSLAGLASKISVSRARAGQLMQSARKARERTTNPTKGDTNA